MIHVIGWKAYALIAVLSAVFIAAIEFVLGPPESVLGFLLLFTKSAALIGALNFLLGNFAIFEWFISLRLVRSQFPQIHGHWNGYVTTNFFEKAELLGLEVPNNKSEKTDVDVTIRVSLFEVFVCLESKSKYLQSDTRACQLSKRDNGKFELAYVTNNTVPVPEKTDEQSFHGAGYLSFEGKKPSSLSGHQWTNRNWTKCLNTAGRVELFRAGLDETES